ncbi:MAG TPA: hypothetical protein VEI26_06865 [Terriglobales bacterium]|nr:hypothetical protein [Terriglobales bacterium]
MKFHEGKLKGALIIAAVCLAGTCAVLRFGTRSFVALAQEQSSQGSVLLEQSQADADRKSAGCISCHTTTDSPTMHQTGTVRLGCTDCHGGDPGVSVPPDSKAGSGPYDEAKRKAHPRARFAEDERSSNNPVRAYTRWLKEDPQYIQFVNPADLRVADKTCGTSGCHTTELLRVRTSMMTHGAMLWGAALYNNGSFPLKDPHFGESYDRNGIPQRMNSVPAPTPEETRTKGVLPYLEPLERWEISQPSNVLRVFERGGQKKGEVGNPNLEEDPGRPDVKLSDRGFGTELRTDPVFLGLQKTRLYDPLLYLPGTNDQPGDYRASGCSGCHVVYANDRSAEHSGPYAQFGHSGESATSDPTIPKGQPGHPIKHQFTRSIPSSQCLVCHMHPGTNMVATYYGYTWWDNEIDGDKMYPKKQHDPSAEERAKVQARNPEGAAPRGRWADPKFLDVVGGKEFLASLNNTQFADFHTHGWLFRAVYKHDRQGNLLDTNNQTIAPNDPDKFNKAVHLKDIHLEKGMHCEDCHFSQDSHGNGKLYGETRNAVEIDCIDCHGTINQRATLKTSGPAAPRGGTDLSALRTPWKERRFYWKDDRLYQRSMINQGQEWEVVQVFDTVRPGHPNYNEKSRLAKTIQTDGKTWGTASDDSSLAHSNQRMTCYACHSAWLPTCFGCHLQQTANQKTPMLHNEGLVTRNYISYNFQILRDDMYMLGVDGTVTKHRIAPIRSACAVLVSSQNADRDWSYYQQQTVSAEGFSGQAFSPFVPHTVRARETRACTDCHVSRDNNNNAWLAQVTLLGGGFMNFMGRYIYVANGNKGYTAVAVAKHDEPPTLYGSDFQKVVYPDEYAQFQKKNNQLSEGYRHAGKVFDVQARGEYLYAATGKGGLRVYDIANVDDKDFSERTITAPVSPIGQRFYVKTKYAQAVASPSTLAVDPLRTHRPENEEQRAHLMYGFLYIADKYEGLVIVGEPNLKAKTPGVGTLLDGDPTNNFLKRALAFNPGGVLNGARRIGFVGTYAYVLADAGLVVVDLDNPLQPKVTAQIGAPELDRPVGIAVQFRYAFIVDRAGLKVVDVTDPAKPVAVSKVSLPLDDARNIYTARTYAYVAQGKHGLAMVDIEHPEQPRLDQTFNAGGKLNDSNDVKLGMVSSSLFAFVADGKNGLQVVQLFGPEEDPNFAGFSPRPMPKLIATYRGSGSALAVSRGIDRDRAVDESGNQLAVFGRRGSRPFNKQELHGLYLQNGQLYTVADEPPGPPSEPRTTENREQPALPSSLKELVRRFQNWW